MGSYDILAVFFVIRRTEESRSEPVKSMTSHVSCPGMVFWPLLSTSVSSISPKSRLGVAPSHVSIMALGVSRAFDITLVTVVYQACIQKLTFA